MEQQLNEAESTVPTKYWHELDDGRIQCDLCPRECKLREGQRGLCYIRARADNEIDLTTYGRSSGFCIDPIEKKPLNHFYPGSAVLSFGTAGCNLACRYCQNWDISKAKQFDVLTDQASPARITQAATSLGCRSIAFTYNDPVIFHEYAIDAAIAAHEVGVKTVAVTAGYMKAAPRREFFKHMDAANIDLKAFTEDFYHRICAGSLRPVLETLQYVAQETGVWLELTTLLIPGYNDSPGEIDAMTRWVVANLGPDVPHHFSAFHPDFRMQDVPATTLESLTRAREIAMDNGERYVFTGNVHDPSGQSTYCHSCNRPLIERNWYQLGAWNLDADGNCTNCGTPCSGAFDPTPGDWGPGRQPVRISRYR